MVQLTALFASANTLSDNDTKLKSNTSVMSLPVAVSFFVSRCLSLSVATSIAVFFIRHSLSVAAFLFHCRSLSVAVYLFIVVFLYPSLSIRLSFSFTVCLCMSLGFYVCRFLSFPVSMSNFVCQSLYDCMSAEKLSVKYLYMMTMVVVMSILLHVLTVVMVIMMITLMMVIMMVMVRELVVVMISILLHVIMVVVGKDRCGCGGITKCCYC